MATSFLILEYSIDFVVSKIHFAVDSMTHGNNKVVIHFPKRIESGIVACFIKD